jgi:tetratricopeptide (TPR) repeat protein
MSQRRIVIAGAVALVATAFVLLGGVLGGSASTPRLEQPRTAVAAAQLLQGFAAGDTRALVATLESRVASNKHDPEALALLGLAYQQRTRETGDPSYYPRSEEALRRALAVERKNYIALTGLASLAASRHDFRAARRLAVRATEANPDSTGAYGILGDALVELGRYEQAFAAFDRMAALKPNLASYARVSYGRELLGRPEAAVEAMRLAVDAGSSSAENVAWTLVQLGNLHFDTGRLQPAASAYRQALLRLPGYVHAEAALARLEAARGRTNRAVSLYRRAVEAVPLPQYAVGLGDVLASAGRTEEAAEAYELVDVIQRLFRANGVRTELETALFDLDHDRAVEDALRRAREAYEAAPGINAEDVLAWALYKNGHCREARGHSVAALRLGTRDALKLFHRGMIESCLGNTTASRAYVARALAINPYFSLLHSPVAREMLA